MNSPPLDPKLHNAGVDLSEAHELSSKDQTGAIDATYFHDLVEVVTIDAAERQGAEPGPASAISGKRKRDPSGGDRGLEEHDDQVIGQTKKSKSDPANDDGKPSSDRPAPEDQEASFSPVSSTARLAAAQPGPAIFRVPSGRKSTRPAVAKEFRNLELCPESFHKLQAYAKKYMLDPDHPERKTYVGNRGQTDNAQIRHDLQRCVREFLEAGPGEEFFGPDSIGPTGIEEGSGANSRSFLWPADKELIIQLCSPLLRRMIVNERQRQYAVKTRRGTKTQDDDDKQVGYRSSQQGITLTYWQNTIPSVQLYLVDQTGKRKLCDRLDLDESSGVTWATVQQTIHVQAARLFTDGRSQINTNSAVTFRVLTADGLKDVSDDRTWQRVLQQVTELDWLEGTVKVVVPMSEFA